MELGIRATVSIHLPSLQLYLSTIYLKFSKALVECPETGEFRFISANIQCMKTYRFWVTKRPIVCLCDCGNIAVLARLALQTLPDCFMPVEYSL